MTAFISERKLFVGVYTSVLFSIWYIIDHVIEMTLPDEFVE